MPDTSMDYMTLIAGSFTIAAAIATIYGVYFAIRNIGEWKRSLRYSKIIEFDTVLNQINKEIEHGLNSFYLYKSALINGFESQIHLDNYLIATTKLEELVDVYQIRGNELIRMGVEDIKNNTPSPVDIIVSIYGLHKNTMDRILDTKKLDTYYYEIFVDRHTDYFKKVNLFLDELKI